MKNNDIYVPNTVDGKTEIFHIEYSDGGFKQKGRIMLDGRLNNQFSMDEYDGYLRVVTSIKDENGEYNANLYVISKNKMKLKTKLEAFAPAGENVKSVRFKNEKAYVCTAKQTVSAIGNQTYSDPVYYIDLSKLNKLTLKDTGEIDGMSFHLIELNDGYLLGVGTTGDDTIKLEIYKETENKVESVAVFAPESEPRGYTTAWKAYYIDRENMLFGLSYIKKNADYLQNNADIVSVLLKFDGKDLIKVAEKPFGGMNYGLIFSRFLVIDGVFHAFPRGEYAGGTKIGEELN